MPPASDGPGLASPTPARERASEGFEGRVTANWLGWLGRRTAGWGMEGVERALTFHRGHGVTGLLELVLGEALALEHGRLGDGAQAHVVVRAAARSASVSAANSEGVLDSEQDPHREK